MRANSLGLVFVNLVALGLFSFRADGSGAENTANSPPTETQATSTVNTVDGLLQAAKNPKTSIIVIQGFLANVPGFRLSPHQSIRGTSAELSGLTFRSSSDGIELTSENSVSSLMLVTAPDRCAIWNDDSVEDMGLLHLGQLKTVGRVRILARNRIRAGHVDVRDLDVVAADSRAATERPKGFGVFVLQGAFTLWNLQSDPGVKITADIDGVSAGRANAPVLGSGIFVGGHGDSGGSLGVQRLETGAVYSEGGIKPGTPDLISGGVFVLHGATVDLVKNEGLVTTFGANDMALDNWGTVDRWIATEKVTTFGPSGIGFVNFGVTRAGWYDDAEGLAPLRQTARDRLYDRDRWKQMVLRELRSDGGDTHGGQPDNVCGRIRRLYADASRRIGRADRRRHTPCPDRQGLPPRRNC